MKMKKTTKIKEPKCCICSDNIKCEPNSWIYGHNAFPYGDRYGNRCCDDCKYNIVIPTRLGLIETLQQTQFI
jgi:hypothetical protein